MSKHGCSPRLVTILLQMENKGQKIEITFSVIETMKYFKFGFHFENKLEISSCTKF